MDKFERNTEREMVYALTPMLTLTQAKNELARGALALKKDADPAKCMEHAFAALEFVDQLEEQLEKLALECALIRFGWSREITAKYHGHLNRSFLTYWRKLLDKRVRRLTRGS